MLPITCRHSLTVRNLFTHLNNFQFSNFEHQFVILPIHICRTPHKGSRDDTQVKDEHLADSQIDNDNVLQSQQRHVNNDA